MAHHGHPFAHTDSECVKPGGKCCGPLGELGVGERTPRWRRLVRFVDDPDAVGVHLGGSTEEVVDSERYVHAYDPRSVVRLTPGCTVWAHESRGRAVTPRQYLWRRPPDTGGRNGFSSRQGGTQEACGWGTSATGFRDGTCWLPGLSFSRWRLRSRSWWPLANGSSTGCGAAVGYAGPMSEGHHRGQIHSSVNHE